MMLVCGYVEYKTYTVMAVSAQILTGLREARQHVLGSRYGQGVQERAMRE